MNRIPFHWGNALSVSSETNLNKHSVLPFQHQRNRHLHLDVSPIKCNPTSPTHSSQYQDMVHDNVDFERGKDLQNVEIIDSVSTQNNQDSQDNGEIGEEIRQLEPSSPILTSPTSPPTPPPNSYNRPHVYVGCDGDYDDSDSDSDDDEIRARVPPPSPRPSTRYLELDDDDNFNKMDLDNTSPSRSRSRSRRVSGQMSRSDSFSRSFQNLNRADESNNANSENHVPGSEEDLDSIFFQGSPPQASMEVSSPRPTPSPPPTYPTPSPYMKIPYTQIQSITELTRLTDFLVNTRALINLTASDEYSKFVSEVSDWKSLLDYLVAFENLSMSSSSGQPTRHGVASYAFTALTISQASKAHSEIHDKLISIANRTDTANLEQQVKELKDKNEKVWSHVKMAWESDQTNEVSGTSWAYGTSDWKKPEAPIAKRWVGGKVLNRPQVPSWPGSIRDDLKTYRSQA